MYKVFFICLIGIMQTPGPPGWDVLAQESSTIIVGVVESKSWIVRKDGMGGSIKVLPDGTVEGDIPNPRDYVVGNLYRLRVEQVLKRNKKIMAASRVEIFVPGYMASHGTPIFLEWKKYLVFVRPLNPEGDSFNGTFTYKPGSGAGEKMPQFKPELNYVVVRGEHGSIGITEKNVRIIDEVKAALPKWNERTGKLMRTLKGHTTYVSSIAFSHDSKILDSGSSDWTVRLWAVETK